MGCFWISLRPISTFVTAAFVRPGSDCSRIIAPVYVRSHNRGFGAFGLGDAAGTIASTIQKVEGYYPGTLAYTNNNPGNLIFVGQAGASPGAGGFASFPTYDAGYQALLNQIQNYANRGLTIDQMMNIYAPALDSKGNPTGNNPTLYANTIANSLGVSTSTTVADALSGASLDDSTGDFATGSDFEDLFSSDTAPDPMMVGAAVLAAGLLLYALA